MFSLFQEQWDTGILLKMLHIILLVFHTLASVTCLGLRHIMASVTCVHVTLWSVLYLGLCYTWFYVTLGTVLIGSVLHLVLCYTLDYFLGSVSAMAKVKSNGSLSVYQICLKDNN